MKRFLKEAGGADQYADVRIEWIRHHTPELAIFDGGRKIQTIDLSPYNYAGLHQLFRTHFPARGSATAGRALSDERAGAPTATATNTTSSTTTTTSSSARPAVPAPLRLHDAALPQPASGGWRAADTPASEIAASNLLLLLTCATAAFALLAGALLARRCALRRRAASPKFGPKTAAMDV